MKQLFLALITVGACCVFPSCEQCKDCTGEAVIEQYLQDSLFSTSTSNVSAVEFCGDDLDMIEANPVVSQEITQQVGQLTQRVVTTTTYTCQ